MIYETENNDNELMMAVIIVVVMMMMMMMIMMISDINFCSSGPCQNGGVCFNQLSGYVCQCPADYSGTNCEICK